MLETFFRTHQFLVEHTDAPVRRLLMGEVDWKKRLIGIKGSRGVGKTTFLLQYAKDTPCFSLPQSLHMREGKYCSSTRCSSIATGAMSCA